MFAHADQPIWASGFKFVDWGTAHQHDLDEAGVPLIEMRKQIEGTDTYMAPEVARGGWQRRGGVCLRWGTRRGARPVGRKRWVGDTRPRSRHLSAALPAAPVAPLTQPRTAQRRCSHARMRAAPASTRSFQARGAPAPPGVCFVPMRSQRSPDPSRRAAASERHRPEFACGSIRPLLYPPTAAPDDHRTYLPLHAPTADIFALGVVFFIMLTGRIPWTSADAEVTKPPEAALSRPKPPGPLYATLQDARCLAAHDQRPPPSLPTAYR